MKQCFGYVRVSSKKQGEGASLDAQKDAISAFAERNEISIVDWFEEQQTAAKKGRPQFNAMVRALKCNAADGVVMHKIDRSARNFFDWAKVGELSDAGIDVHFAVESLDFRSRGGRLAANIQMAVAEDYCRNLGEEVRKGQTALLKQGIYPFCAPIGYINNGKGKLKTPDPVRAPLLKLAFELYASGQYSIRSLHEEMNRRGLRGTYGRHISKRCLEDFLANLFYTGIIHIRRTGTIYQGAHEPLISVELFEAVQDIKAGKYHKKKTRHNHTYRGLFVCGDCNRSMIPEKQKGYVYYRCQVKGCSGNCVREERLEEAISSGLEQVAMSDEQASWLLRQFKAWWSDQNADAKTQLIDQQLIVSKQRQDRLTDAFIDGQIDEETFQERKKSLLLERVQLEEQRTEAKKFGIEPTRAEQFLELVISLAQHYKMALPAEKREIVEFAFSNRSVQAKKVFVEPANWLQGNWFNPVVPYCADEGSASRTRPGSQNSKPSTSCADDGSTSRTRPECQNSKPRMSCTNGGSTSRISKGLKTGKGSCKETEKRMQHLVDAANSPEVKRLLKIIMKDYQKAAKGALDDPSDGGDR